DRRLQVEVVEPGHAHEARHAVDLGGAGAALAGLAVPARGQVGRALGLDLVHGVEDDHAGADVGGVVLEAARAALAAPDAEGRARLVKGVGHFFCSSTAALSSAGMGATGAFSTRTAPSFSLTTMLKLSPSLLFSGKSSRKWPPRLSLRSSAARVMHSATVSRLRRSSAVCHPGL